MADQIASRGECEVKLEDRAATARVRHGRLNSGEDIEGTEEHSQSVRELNGCFWVLARMSKVDVNGRRNTEQHTSHSSFHK